MRVNAGFSRLLRLDGIWVRRVQFDSDQVVVSVALRRRRLRCPLCGYSTSHRHNRSAGPVDLAALGSRNLAAGASRAAETA